MNIDIFLLSESFGGESHRIYSEHCALKREKYVSNDILVLWSNLFIFSIFSKDSSVPLCYLNIPDFDIYSI